MTPYHLLQTVKEEMRSQNHNRPQGATDARLAMESLNFTHGSAPSNETVHFSHATEIALPIFMFAGGAIGNIIAVIVLSVSRQLRKPSAFYSLVCGLAVTDLLGTCLASPLTIADYLDERVLRNARVCAFHSFVLLFFGLTGLSIMCAMAAERYLAICWPYAYQRWGVGRCFARKFLLLIYTSHVLFCCLPVLGTAGSELQASGTWCFIEWRSAYALLYGALSLLLILSTMALNVAVCGALLLMRRRSARRRVSTAGGPGRWRCLSSAAETQMITVLVMTSVVVLTCSAPLVVSKLEQNFWDQMDDARLEALRH